MAELPMGGAPIPEQREPGPWLPMPPSPMTENEKRTHAAQAYPEVPPLMQAEYNGEPLPHHPQWKPVSLSPQGNLVQAVELVAKAVTARIAYHQAEIDALRRALQPFQKLSQQLPSASAPLADDAVDQLLSIARSLNGASQP